MDKENALEWQVIDWVIEEQYGGDKDEAIAEMGDLDELAFRIAFVIDKNQLTGEDGVIYISSVVDEELF